MNIQKKTAASLAVVTGLGAALAGGFAAQSAQAHPPVLATARLAAARQEPHPTMLAALRALSVAERNLTVSSRDFGGHRVKALTLTQQAMAEIQKGIQYDNAHPDGH